MGNVHEVAQGEGGEQGDPLMPALFSLGLHPALAAVQERLSAGERLLAFLDDIYIVCRPTRVLADPDAVVWEGDAEIPDQERGVRVLGAPIDSSEYVLAQLNAKSREQRLLFQRIPTVPDLQSAWLLLLFCGATRANFWLRMVRPELTAQFAEQHDSNVWQCFATLLGLPEGQPAVAVSMPLNKSGLGLGSAVRSQRAAHWANWADCLSMVNKRDSATARWMVESIQHDPAACFHAVRDCQRELANVAGRRRR